MNVSATNLQAPGGTIEKCEMANQETQICYQKLTPLVRSAGLRLVPSLIKAGAMRPIVWGLFPTQFRKPEEISNYRENER